MTHHEDDLAALVRKVFCRFFPSECCRLVRDVTITLAGHSFTATSLEGKIMLTVKDTDVPGSGTYKFSFKDAKGKPAKVDGLPTISSSDPTIVDTVGPCVDNGDGTFSAPFHVLDNIGAANVTVNADVDLGSGTNNKDFVDVVSVIAGDAATLVGDFGTITPDPAPAPAPGP